MKYFSSKQFLKTDTIKKWSSFIMFLFLCLGLVSCSKELEVQTNFPFTLEIMPVPSSIEPGEIVEIPCHIKREGYYSDTQYSIRYFQYEGVGRLMFQEEKSFQPNKLYKIPTDSFKLHYKPKSKEGHKFQIWVSDQFGNEKTAEFDFN